MNFADSRFWILLVSGLAVIALLRIPAGAWLGSRVALFDRLALIALGLWLLVAVSWVTCLIFLIVAVFSYCAMCYLVRRGGRHSRLLLVLFVPLQLLPLLYFKYADFILNDTLGGSFDTLRGLIIPAGISFYTFQMMSFVIDTLAFGRPLPRVLDFLNFAGFFPQVVAGPIERREDLLPQMEQFKFRWSTADLNAGAAWVAVGMFFKCCLADNAAIYVDRTSVSNPFSIWLANLMFGLRIYYDFAGYSLVAVGFGRCLGIRLTLNFLSPYCSTSIREFWHRWHVTLSGWFRTYVYLPLGGGRTRWWMLNVAVVFVVSGLWHGAGWGFLLWGAFHGIALIVNRALGGAIRLPRFVAWVVTLVAVLFGWVFFYETRTPDLLAKLGTLCNPMAYTAAAVRETLTSMSGGHLFALTSLLLLVAIVWAIEWLSVARRDDPYCYLRHPVAAVMLVVLTVLLAPGNDNAFIYFAF
ncbi:MAG TPA: MBOAT family O-acyltransferase [Verrucomicrobiota bacterium]|nr:MBOAT family O-acyltransferase [Verrucomicrobiota bacterium]